jgi:hypothetical protein
VSFHPLPIQCLSGLGVPVAIGFGLGADEAGDDQAGHGTGELGLGQDGVVDAVGLRDDLGERVAVVGAISLNGGETGIP